MPGIRVTNNLESACHYGVAMQYLKRSVPGQPFVAESGAVQLYVVASPADRASPWKYQEMRNDPEYRDYLCNLMGVNLIPERPSQAEMETYNQREAQVRSLQSKEATTFLATALDLLRQPCHQKRADLAWLPVLHECIETGPWWDHNDEISGGPLGLLLQRHPLQMKPLLRQWAQGPNLWFRRAAMLGQRSLKGPDFDAALLYGCILPSLPPHPLAAGFAAEFFIRKGMGWALRERSYEAPDEVQAFCDEYRSRLSPLTRREALKVVNKRRIDSGAARR